MKTMMNTHLGNISIDSDVIANYAGSVAIECIGVVEWQVSMSKTVWLNY